MSNIIRTVHLAKDKETTNTVRYNETALRDDQSIRNIYLSKKDYEAAGKPEYLEIEIRVAAEVPSTVNA